MESNIGAWSVVLLFWLLVPLGIGYTTDFFLLDNSTETPQTWDTLLIELSTDYSDTLEIEDTPNQNLTLWEQISYWIEQGPGQGYTAGLLLDLKTYVLDSGKTFFIETVDWAIGWAIEPIYNYYQRFSFNVDILTSQFGVSSSITNILKMVWILPAFLLGALIFIEIIKALGGLIPTT